MSIIHQMGHLLRGGLLVLAGIMISLSSGCRTPPQESSPNAFREQVIYSDAQYEITEHEPIHKPSPHEGLEFVFIPLTFQNSSDTDIIFSSYVCVNASARPSETGCLPADRDAIACGREQIPSFRLFDGVIGSHETTDGWLALELPEKSESVHVSFRVGVADGEILSFDCQL